MKTKLFNSYVLAVTTVIFNLVVIAPLNAATISFTGTLGFVEVDNGSTTYSGLSIGEVFSGSFTYGDSAADASTIMSSPPNYTDYVFTGAPYGGVVTGGSITTTGTNSLVAIGNDDDTGDDAVFLNNLYGAGSISPSIIADTWGIDSGNATQNFGLAFYSLDTTIFPGLGFQLLPPPLSESDFAIFYIGEVDSLGNTTYLASGKLTSISTVPVPAAVWLFGSGLLGLIAAARRKTW